MAPKMTDESKVYYDQFWKLAEMMWKWILFGFTAISAIGLFAYGDTWLPSQSSTIKAVSMTIVTGVGGLHFIGFRFMLRAMRGALHRAGGDHETVGQMAYLVMATYVTSAVIAVFVAVHEHAWIGFGAALPLAALMFALGACIQSDPDQDKWRFSG